MTQQLKKKSGFQMLLNRVERVTDSVCRCRRIYLYRDRGMQYVVGQPPDIIGHGCREQQRLSLSRYVPDNLSDIRQAAHLEHPVGLVQYKDFQMGQVDGALIDMIQQAAGAGHGDFDAGTKLLNLRLAVFNALDSSASVAAVVGTGGD